MTNYIKPFYIRGMPSAEAANTSNVVVTSTSGGKRKRRRRTIKKGGGSIVYSGPTHSTTTAPTNYSIIGTSQNLAMHTKNAEIQSSNDSLTGGRKSKRRKSKRRKEK